MDSSSPVPFDNSYARLGERFYTRQLPVPVAKPELIRVNHPLARTLGIDPHWLESGQGVEFLAGNRVGDACDAALFVEARLGPFGLENVEDAGERVDLLAI